MTDKPLSLNERFGQAKRLTAVPDPEALAASIAAHPAGKARGQRWAQRKLADSATELARMPANSGRNDALNAIAYSCGRLIPGGWLSEQNVRDVLEAAGMTSGLEHTETMATVDSGVSKGILDPRDPPITLESTPLDPQPFSDNNVTDSDGTSVEETPGQKVRRLLPTIDWHTLWADTEQEEWIIEPLLPARRLIALYSAPKVGKSLLMLELAVAIVTGRDVLGVTIDRPRDVLYVDFENDPKADIRERLQAMGVGPADLGRLHYLSFPTLAALDSERGGLELMAAVTEYAAEVVVVDTVSRAIAGEENENDTWLSFYRHTGLLMKQKGIALIRLDHSGKDETKGQRGGSAKSGDVDAVWRLSRVKDETYRLDCEANRFPITERTLVIHRELTPLRHRVDGEGKAAAWRIKVEACIRALDALKVPDEASNSTARSALKTAGERATSEVMQEAVRRRHKRTQPVDNLWIDRTEKSSVRHDQLDAEW